jgi:ATP-dependent DNA ligase
MFNAFEFCIPTASTKVSSGPEWLHEIKHDGFRLRVERDGGYDWTKRYPWIVEETSPIPIYTIAVAGLKQ